jgi:hypothetical protein
LTKVDLPAPSGARQSEHFAQTGFRVRFDEDNGAR